MAPPLEGRILASAIEFRAATVADVQPPAAFDGTEHARRVWREAVMLDAHETFAQPCTRPPTEPHLHAIDLHTSNPGILVMREGKVVERRMRRLPSGPGALPPASPPHSPTPARRVRRAAVERRIARAHDSALARRLPSAVRGATAADAAPEPAAPPDATPSEARAARAPSGAPDGPSRAGAPRTATAENVDVLDKRRRAQERRARRVHDACLREHGVCLAEPCEPDPDCPYTLFDSAVTHDRLLEGLRQSAPLHEDVEAAVACGRPSDAVTLFDGPPGTGKTQRLIHDVRAVVSAERERCRIALIHPSNTGCAALYTRLHLAGLSCALLIPPQRMPADIPKFARRDDSAAQIVVCTPAGRRGLRLTRQRFTHLFIDEAGQVPEMVVWALLDEAVRGLHMYGDVKQLPGVLSQRAMTLGLQRSLMERLIDSGYPCAAAREQHRMRAEIVAFPSRRFYDGALRASEQIVRDRPPLTAPAYAFVPVSGTEQRVGTSYANQAEADVVRALVTDLMPCGQVVVLVPYLAQAQLLRDVPVSVMTVDAFQGREADVVILTLVRTAALGFWNDERRLNVALTRARDVLRVVGARWEGDGVLAALYADAVHRGAVAHYGL